MQAPISAKDHENEGTQLFPFYRRDFKFVPVKFDVGAVSVTQQTGK
jgi:hypothetical protein